MKDVKDVLSQYGEVLEVRKGQLSRKLPNVTNGTWTVRMIVGEDKVIPSFVFVKDDGEIWQLAHDNQETICWQCGKRGHIGSRCKEKAVSIEHDLVSAGQQDGQLEGVPAAPVQTWAHVVRGVGGRQHRGQLVRKKLLRLQLLTRLFRRQLMTRLFSWQLRTRLWQMMLKRLLRRKLLRRQLLRMRLLGGKLLPMLLR